MIIPTGSFEIVSGASQRTLYDSNMNFAEHTCCLLCYALLLLANRVLGTRLESSELRTGDVVGE